MVLLLSRTESLSVTDAVSIDESRPCRSPCQLVEHSCWTESAGSARSYCSGDVRFGRKAAVWPARDPGGD